MTTPKSVRWTDRGFRWVRKPRKTAGLWGCALMNLSFLAMIVVTALLLFVGAPKWLTILVVLAIPILGTVLSLWAARHSSPGFLLEVEGGTLRFRTTHVLVEFDLENVEIQHAPDRVRLIDDREDFVVPTHADTPWLVDALHTIQHRWTNERGGPLPESAAAALETLGIGR